jgi:hypothetical protein
VLALGTPACFEEAPQPRVGLGYVPKASGQGNFPLPLLNYVADHFTIPSLEYHVLVPEDTSWVYRDASGADGLPLIFGSVVRRNNRVGIQI